MVTETELMTAREFARLPKQSQPIQLIGGVVVVSPSPTPRHQSIVLRLGRYFGDVADTKQLGEWYVAPLDLRVSAYDVYQPDLCFFLPEDLPDPELVPITARPAIVVEVLSPGTRLVDLKEKLPQYAARGVPEYWIFDPADRRFSLHMLGEDGTYSATPVISGPIPIGLFAGTPIDLESILSR